MSEIEKMKKYIERTNTKKAGNYYLSWCEAGELCDLAQEPGAGLFEALALAFNYGKAKGYRAAKAKMKEAST